MDSHSIMSHTRDMKMKTISIAVGLLIPIGLVAPTAINAAPNTTKQITVKQVKKHNTQTDCWSIVNGKVYNLTDWVSKHPGGSIRIIAMCGTNASKAFNAQHAGQGSPATNLSEYQIGIVKKKR